MEKDHYSPSNPPEQLNEPANVYHKSSSYIHSTPLNNRKDDFIKTIQAMEEDEFELLLTDYYQRKADKTIPTIKNYPFAPTNEELDAWIKEAEEDILAGRGISHEEMKRKYKL